MLQKHDLRIKNLFFAAALVVAVGCGKGKVEGSGEEAKKPLEPVEVQVAVAAIRPMETTVSAQGVLVPAQGASTKVSAVTAGRLASVFVREGDRVLPGQLLSTIDNRPQQAQVRSAGAAASAAQAQAREAELAAQYAKDEHAANVTVARLALESAQAENVTNVMQADAALKTVQAEFQKTRMGARPQEVAQAEQAVRQTQATRDRAATELERVKFLFEKGIDSRKQFEDAQTALAVADSALETAKQQLSLVHAGARPEDLRTAELKVHQAQAALNQMRSTGAAKVAQARAAFRQARQAALQVDVKRQEAAAAKDTAVSKRADLAGAQASARYSELRSLIAGTVIKRNLNPGDMADPAVAVVEIADTRILDINASIPADSAKDIRSGLPVHVSAADVPGVVLPGRVLSVGQVDPQTNLLTVRISLSGNSGRLKSGGFATASIIMRTNPRAVTVPKSAVITKEGKSTVFLATTEGKASQKEVTVGAEQGGLVEILTGVKAGDRVITEGQYELPDGAPIKIAEEKEKTPVAKEAGDKKAAD